jgi:carbamoyltransferase
MDILGISAFYHDSAACLLRDGQLLAAAQEERFTRTKHDFRFPKNAIQYCLSEAGKTIDQIDAVAFYDKPFLKLERLLESYLSRAPDGLPSFFRSMPIWMRQKIRMRSIIRKELGWDGEILFGEHHESHAASAFFPSPFEEAAIVTADGVGEWATSSIGLGRGNRVELLKTQEFPHSLGLLYSAFTYFTGFKVNSGEYKLMGLAPYGEPRYVDQILEELIDLKPDGSFRLNMRYFDYLVGLRMTNRGFAKLFDGPARKPESDLTRREMDLARSIQVVTEEIMLRIARHAHETTGMKNLCLAGGVALNCVANGRILREGPFENLWIQPAAGDAGGALGVAYAVWHQMQRKPRATDGDRDQQRGSYLGPSFTPEEIEEALRPYGAVAERTKSEEELVENVADLIANEQVVGWFQGRMEFGPRALGSRSILGDARSSKMQSVMNLKIKYRESFRPFAPTVLVEHAPNWFEIDRPSPYMLLTAYVRPEHRRVTEDPKAEGLEKLKQIRSVVPAITHVDCSARLQTVSREDHRLYHDLISTFHRNTGCPLIINTSFNVRGEPIVCTPEDAYRCFMRTEMDVLAIGPFILRKDAQPAWKEGKEWQKDLVLD